MSNTNDPTGLRRLVAAATEAEDACHQIASCGHKAYCNLCHGGGECTCGIQRARDSLRELAAVLAAVRVDALERVVDGSRRLIEKLKLIHNDSTYLNVWLCAEMHFGKYAGPKYTEELDGLEESLAALDATKGDAT